MKIGSIQTLGIQNRMKETNLQLNRILGQMSEGTRLTPFRGDTVASTIANSLRTKSLSLAQAERDTSVAASMLLTASEALETQNGIAQKMREVSLQASNSSLTDLQRESLQAELNDLLQEFERIASSTDFNGQKLLQSSSSLSFLLSDSAQSEVQLQFKSSRGVDSFREFRGTARFGTGETIDAAASGSTDIEKVRFEAGGTEYLAYRTGSTMRFQELDEDGALTGSSLDVAMGVTPTSYTFGDVTGNGFTDIIVLQGNNIRILEGSGDGNFGSATTITTLGAGFDGNFIKIADLEGNGTNDIVVGNGGTSVRIITSDGEGNFSTEDLNLSAGVTGSRLEIADFNNDNILDLFVMGASTGNAQMFFGDGDGSYTGQSTAAYGVGASTHIFEFGDLNGDGNLDFVMGGTGSATLSRFYGDGQGGFTAGSSINNGTNVSRFKLADLDSDNTLDLVVTNTGVAGNVYKGTETDFSFVQSVGGTVGAIRLEDVNADGVIDLINNSNTQVDVYYGVGSEQSSVSFLDLGSEEAAVRSVEIIDTAMDKISERLASISAQMSRFESAARAQSEELGNLWEAEDEIRSLDYAVATADLLKQSILQQSQTAIFAQALNQQTAIITLLQTGGLI